MLYSVQAAVALGLNTSVHTLVQKYLLSVPDNTGTATNLHLYTHKNAISAKGNTSKNKWTSIGLLVTLYRFKMLSMIW